MQATIHVTGTVQGVGFRPFIYTLALNNNLNGYVQNLGDAGVRILAEGPRDHIETFLEQIKNKSPPLARIEDIHVQWNTEKHTHKNFTIKQSLREKMGEKSIVPPDVSICEECLHDLKEKKNRRHNYFFTTCTNCGPRYTIIRNLPYDRPTTTMSTFPMCSLCTNEYTNPTNRRYHAQTIACHDCGPQVYFTDKETTLMGPPAIKHAAQLLTEGKIIAIKGNGGFHLACTITNDKAIKQLRNTLGRKEKPFAIMARDIQTTETLVEINKDEKNLLTSPIRPILVLNKKILTPTMSLIAPGLHNIGIMLPYTGLHHMLFHYTNETAYVLTSANLPGEPIIYEDDKMKQFTENVLYYNREIYQRCDDSVIRFIQGAPLFLRRSRGYVPTPVTIKFNAKNIVAFGPELDVVSCVLTGKKAFLSQYIGNTQRYETLNFLEEATQHLLNLTHTTPEGIACDLHPHFNTTRVADRWSKNLKIPLTKIQHHHAHIASVMAENGMGIKNEIIGIAVDGAGYGDDETIWGGEVLHCTLAQYHRIGHLEKQPMIGGDLATRYPLRMVAGILSPRIEEKRLRNWLSKRSKKFPHGEQEIDTIFKQHGKKHVQKTSSCGRILDAVAALLDVCWERTYEGEPAMKLEAAAQKGENILHLEPRIIHDTIVDTTYLLEELWNNKDIPTKNLAYTAQSYLAQGLAQVALIHAEKTGIDTIGLSGGCAYNDHLSTEVQREIESRGLKLLRKRYLPLGDGGISFGQAVAATAQLI